MRSGIVPRSSVDSSRDNGSLPHAIDDVALSMVHQNGDHPFSEISDYEPRLISSS